MKTKLLTLVCCFFAGLGIMAKDIYPGINNEAKDLKDQGNYLEAAKKYKEFRDELAGQDLLDVLYPEAECYYMLDDYEQLKEVVSLYKYIFEDSYYFLGDSLDIYKAYLHKMMGNLYYHNSTNLDTEAEDYEKELNENLYDAIQHYKKSLNIFRIRNNDVNANAVRMELAQLYYKFNEYSYAYKYLNQNLAFYKGRIENYVLSDEANYYNTLALMALCNARMANLEEEDDAADVLFDEGLSQIDKAIAYGSKLKNISYYNWLRIKGKILMIRYDKLGIDDRAIASKCYEQYVNYFRKNIGEDLSGMTESQRQQIWLAMHDFLFDCYRLGNESPEMLYDLALFSKNYLLENKQTGDVKWKQIRKLLKKQECAIEFVQYKGTNEEPMLGCLVLRKDSKAPVFIDIAKIDSLLTERVDSKVSLKFAITYQPHGYKNFVVKNWLYNDTALFHKIWTPQLMTAIGDANKIFFSPDGMLHQLAIEYMMPDSLKDCYRLSSTRMLQKRGEKVNTEKMLLMGDMDYYTEITPQIKDNDEEAYDYFAGERTIGELPFAKEEVDSIMESRVGLKDTVLTGKDATDENLLKLLPQKYPIVHIATHGYYVGEVKSGTDLKPTTYDKTMSKSGIVFAGLLSTVSNRHFDKTLFDGILSARETAKLNMKDVELVTLSACQTGLGEITSDGVFGMQRGLRQAGAKSMMISLWSVNNYSSSVFYKFFYQALSQQKEKSFHEALKTARKKMKNNIKIFKSLDLETLEFYDDVWDFGTPQHTHPYILIDAF